jgi:hypothetical protein
VTTETTTLDFRRPATVALGLGALGLIAAVIGAFFGTEAFFQSYLFAFLFWLGLALGCLVLLAVNHMAGGSWGAVIRRPLEAGVAVLPVMALFFIPLLFGMNLLYVWTDASYLATNPTVEAKTAYLNTPILYFGLWILAATMYLRSSSRQDDDAANSGAIGYRLKSRSPLWLIVYVITMTFAAIDWGMSLTPVWWSGIYGAILMISQAIVAISFVIAIMVWLAGRNAAINELLTAKRLQDLGNFLMAFIMFWAYTSVSQLIIQWSNNVVETNTWYVARLSEGWVGVGVFLLFFGFFAPFGILFSRWVKRKRRALTLVAFWAILVQGVNLFWFIIPTYERTGAQVTWLDFALLIGIGGIFMFAYFRSLGSRPILPLHDPRLSKAGGH